MELITVAAELFMGLFQEGGKTLLSLVTGILPTLACLLVVVNAVVKFIGEDKLERFAEKAASNVLLRYVALPFLSFFILANPMGFSMARFLPEKYKASFFDSVCSGYGHPATALFPHTNSGELFVWLGIAQGIQKLGLPIGGLAVRYLLAGAVLGLIRGVLTEKLWLYFARKKGLEIDPQPVVQA